MPLVNHGLLKLLAETPGASGHEEHVRVIVREEMAPLVDDVRTDALGNLIGTRNGRPDLRVMVAAHMDELGFMVKWIDDAGFVRVHPIGYSDPASLVGERIVVSAASGRAFRGVVQATRNPPVPRSLTESRAAPFFDDLYLDLGLCADEVKQHIEVGDQVTMDRSVEFLGDSIVGKALDDRAGVFILLEALRSMRTHEATIFAVATAQEESGMLRTPGSTAAGSALAPTVMIAVDAANARDVPGAGREHTQTALGKGAGLKIRDMGAISHPRLVRHFRDIAERDAIPHQLELNPWGATDITHVQLQNGGCAAMTLSIPTRYVHTPSEMINANDVQSCIDLLARYLEEAHTGDYAL